jgi:hypothetical protein
MEETVPWVPGEMEANSLRKCIYTKIEHVRKGATCRPTSFLFFLIFLIKFIFNWYMKTL